MNQEILHNLKPGEKVADIQEYYWGKNGFRLAFKVTIYTCKYKRVLGLFKKRIVDIYEFPFYFEYKELAEMYIKDHDNYNIIQDSYFDYGIRIKCTYSIVPKNIEKPHNRYYLIDAYKSVECPCSKSQRLKPGGIWGGYVSNQFAGKYVDCLSSYTEIYKIEEIASKEGSIGKTYSYKLSEV